MNEDITWQVGDIVFAHITGVLATQHFKITNIDLEGKNGMPVADLVAVGPNTDSANETGHRWQYLERLQFLGRGEDFERQLDLIVEDEQKSEPESTETFRAFRERLGLSRREVQEAASVSGSALWRIEQNDGGTPEQRTAVWDFLIGFETEHPEGKSKATVKKTSKSLSISTQIFAQRIDRAIAELDVQIAKATANKTSTKGLRAIKVILEGTVSE